MKFESMEAPRMFPNADKPGSYQIATLTKESILNPGDNFSFEHFITGYGEISGAKMQCYFSPDVFDHAHSTVDHSINQREIGNGQAQMYWGSIQTKIDPSGFASSLRGVEVARWKQNTLFFDASEEINGVATERRYGSKEGSLRIGNAPFLYNLKTNKKIKPGDHHIDFYFTYFNGWEWICSKERVSFKINNMFERYATPLSIIATIAILLSIFKDGIYPILDKFIL